MKFALLLAGMLVLPGARAQAHESSLSDAEVESLRDAAYIPNDRVNAYIKILDTRADRIHKLVTARRKPGREQDLHDLLDDFAGLADELNDNLDELGPKHRDIRKALPKLMDATERWATTLRSAPEDATYKVVQKLALDSLTELRDAATKLNSEEIAYFKAHPDAAKAEAERANPSSNPPEPVEIPR